MPLLLGYEGKSASGWFCPNNLHYVTVALCLLSCGRENCPAWSRTMNLPIQSRMLYLELQGKSNGASGGTRTHDCRLTRSFLSLLRHAGKNIRLSITPEKSRSGWFCPGSSRLMKPAHLLLCYGASIVEFLTHQAAFRRAQSPALPVKKAPSKWTRARDSHPASPGCNWLGSLAPSRVIMDPPSGPAPDSPRYQRGASLPTLWRNCSKLGSPTGSAPVRPRSQRGMRLLHHGLHKKTF